eukprot:g45207.t1
MSSRQVHQLEETEKASGILGLPPGVTLETETLPSSNHGTSRHGFTFSVGPLRQTHQLEEIKRDLEGRSIEAETLTSSKHGTDRVDTVGPLASQKLLASVILLTAAVLSGYAASSAKSDVSALNALLDQAKAHIVLYQADIQSLTLQHADLVSTYESTIYDAQLAFNRSLTDTQSAYKAELAEVKLQYDEIKLEYAAFVSNSQLALNRSLADTQSAYKAELAEVKLQYDEIKLEYAAFVSNSQLALNRSLADTQSAYKAELAEVKLQYAALVSAFASSIYDAQLGFNNTLKLKQDVNSAIILTLDQVNQVEHEILSFNQSYPYPWEIEAETKTHAQALNTVVGKLYGCEYRQVGCCYTTVQLVPTNGAKSWEAFRIGNVTYLLVANTFDGSTYLVNSVLYRVDQRQPASPLVQVQNIPTKGAYDWEAFQIGGVTYLIVANHYDGSTYLVNSVLYRFDQRQPASPLVQVQTIPTKGAQCWEAFQIGNVTYLIVANHYDGSTWLLNSVLYRFNEGEPASPLIQVQTIPTKGAQDWEAFQLGNVTYLIVANYYDGSTYLVNSVLYRFDQRQPASPLVQVQTIPTKCAQDWKAFQIGGVTYLLVANHYDGSAYVMDSVLYRFDQGQPASLLVQVQNIPTKSAYDWEAFQIGSVTYLLVANHYDGSTKLVNSVLYRFDQGQSASPLVQVQNIQTKGAFEWEVFQMGNVTYLLVANYYDGSTYLVNSVPISPQASLDLLRNPEWTDVEVYAQYLGPAGSLVTAEKLWNDIGEIIPVEIFHNYYPAARAAAGLTGPVLPPAPSGAPTGTTPAPAGTTPATTLPPTGSSTSAPAGRSSASSSAPVMPGLTPSTPASFSTSGTIATPTTRLTHNVQHKRPLPGFVVFGICMLRASKAPIYVAHRDGGYGVFAGRYLPPSFQLGLLEAGGRALNLDRSTAFSEHFTMKIGNFLQTGMHPIQFISPLSRNALHLINSSAKGFNPEKDTAQPNVKVNLIY